MLLLKQSDTPPRRNVRARPMDSLALNRERFVGILEKLVNEGEQLQNQPPQHVPREKIAADIILEALRPHTIENGGPLRTEYVEFTAERGNVIITYQHPQHAGCSDGAVVSFVGSHMDVVVANRERWERGTIKWAIRVVVDALCNVGLQGRRGSSRPYMHLTLHRPF